MTSCIIILVPVDPVPSTDLSGHCTHMDLRHTCRTSSHRHKIVKSKKKKKQKRRTVNKLDKKDKCVAAASVVPSHPGSVHPSAMSSNPSLSSEVF